MVHLSYLGTYEVESTSSWRNIRRMGKAVAKLQVSANI